MSDEDATEKWIENAMETLNALSEDDDDDLTIRESAVASAHAQIACAMSLVRIADSLEKLVEQNQKSIV